MVGLYIIITSGNRLVVDSAGAVCYYPSRSDAKAAAQFMGDARVLSVAERQAEVDQ